MYVLHSRRCSPGDLARAEALLEEALAINRETGHREWEAINLRHLGELAVLRGDGPQARECLEASLILSRTMGSLYLEAWALSKLGEAVLAEGDARRAQELLEESLALWQRMEPRVGASIAIHGLGKVAGERSEGSRARSLFGEARSLLVESGDLKGLAWLDVELGVLALGEGNLPRARSLLEHAAEVFGEDDSLVHLHLATALLESGEPDAARSRLRPVLKAAGRAPLPPLTAACLERAAAIAVAVESWETAARFLGAAAAMRDRMGIPGMVEDRRVRDKAARAGREALGEGDWNAAFAEGRAMSLEQAVDYALEYLDGDDA